MHYLADQREQAVAILYQNILLDPFGTIVFGVILGNCVFDGSGEVRAKYFNHTLFNLEGRILARHNGIVQGIAIKPAAVMTAAWEVVRGISDHRCPMIHPLQDWSGVPVAEFFSSRTIGTTGS